ncbi:aromatic hydrocarbon degradation membrane protein [Brucella abortus]|nr:aromatic hydrocarbon degradation membrane protein [Brucella abortus]
MKMGRVKIAGFVAALLGSTVMAHAGGFERGSQDFDILLKMVTPSKLAEPSLRHNAS